jgi:hypothetical protein
MEERYLLKQIDTRIGLYRTDGMEHERFVVISLAMYQAGETIPEMIQPRIIKDWQYPRVVNALQYCTAC